MSMSELVQEVNGVKNAELMRAIECNGEAFNSHHEGYAVLLEEFEEAQEEFENVERRINDYWESVRTDQPNTRMIGEIKDIRFHALLGACELIQVAAMCDKCIRTSQVLELKKGEVM